MNVPRRILDGGSGDWERTILKSAARDMPTPEFRKRMTKELGLLTSVATLTGATTVSGQTLGVVAWVKLLGVGALMGLATAGVSYAISDAPIPAAPQGSAHGVPTSPPAAIAPPRANGASEASKTLAPPSIFAPVVSPRAAHQTATVETSPVTPGSALPLASALPSGSALPSRAAMPATDSALSEELRAIERVRGALAAGDATAALSELDRYEAASSTKLFSVEAQVLRIEALARLGNDAGARALARRFLDDHPESPYVRRVRSLVGDEQ